MTDIDKKIPMPPSKKGRDFVYPFAEMEVGDSFEVPIDKRRSVASSAYSYKLSHPTKDFSTRKIDNVTVRIWRTK